MLSSFRRLSKTKVGSAVLVLFVIAIAASFALGDISSLGSGSFGPNSSTLVSVGKQDITDRDMSRAMERRLADARQQNPEADYSTIAGDFEALLAGVIDQRTLQAFAQNFGLTLSKRLVDAEIAQIPGTRGLDGRFNDQAYQAFLQQQRLTDADVRDMIGGALIQRMLLAPVATNARIPLGMATPYASMLLEARQGDVATIPIDAFRSGLNPSDADLQRFYAANRNRYMIPEQRILRIARIGLEQVQHVSASAQEIAAFYNANQAIYGAKDIRVISQAVIPDRGTANAIAARARGGGTFAAATAPAGLSAADVSVGPQTRAEFSSLAGDEVAEAAFAAQRGAIVGPIQSDLGWHVVRIDEIRREGGKPLEQARTEISARLTAEKRRNALTELVTQIEDSIAEGANFAEAAASARLPTSQTPLITGAGIDRANTSFRFPPDLGPALRVGFELAANDEPVVETLPGEAGFVLVAPAQIVPASPAPLADIRGRVREDWIAREALKRARTVANTIATKASRNIALPQAVREVGAPLPPVRGVGSRRIELSQPGTNVPAPVRMLFNLSQGKSRVVPDPQGRGFFVVRVNRIVPGNALSEPGLIGRVQTAFQDAVTEEYAAQFLGAARKSVGVERNGKAIEATKRRITGN